MRLAAGTVISAEAGDKQNPDQPFTAIVSAAASAAEKSTAVVAVAIAVTIIIVSEYEKQDDNPDKVASAAHAAGVGSCITATVVSS